MTSDAARQRFFSLTIAPHLDDALTLARWITGNPADAEDVAQEACIKAMAAMDGFRGGLARAWVLAIVRNTAYTWLRRHRPMALVSTGDHETAQALAGQEGDDSPESAMIQAQTHAQVQAAIASLELPHREIIVLRDINGLSYREIADLLGLPVGTVMSRLARARVRLIAALKEGPA